MLPIVNKPLLEHTIDGLKSAGIKDIAIVIGYLGEMIQEYFGDGSKQGVNIEYLTQSNPQGTASATILAEKIVGSEPFIMQYGDVLISASDYKSLLKKYETRKPDSIISVFPVDDPSQYGVIAREGGKVKKIIEKPEPGSEPSNLVNAGLYIFNSGDNIISNNNFIDNGPDELSGIRYEGNAYFYYGINNIFSGNRWSGNYWSDYDGDGVKVIYGHLNIPLIIFSFDFPWFNIDWQPAQTPYEIS